MLQAKTLSSLVLISIIFLILPQANAQNSLAGYQLPELFVANSNAEIKGNFHDEKEDISIFFEKDELPYPAEILTKTDSTLTIKTPERQGIYHLFIDAVSANTFIEETVRVVEMELSIGKTNMRRGQKTQLNIRLNGLENYTRPIAIEVKNLSPSTIKLPAGTSETVVIYNEEGANTVDKQLEITAIKRGDFDIEVNLNPDERLVYYDPEQLKKEMDKAIEDSSFYQVLPPADTLAFIKDFFKDNYSWHPEPNIPYDHEKMMKELAKLIQDASDETNKNGLGYILDLLKQFLKYHPIDTLKTSQNGEESGGPTTTSGKPRYPTDDGGKKDSSVCTCGISGAIYHALPNKCYTLTSILEKDEVIRKFRDGGIQIPQKGSDGFRGENLSIIPGTAYSASYGDIVGGYANGIANMWGKEVEDYKAHSMNFETDYIATKAKAKGNHYIEIKPAANEWSYVVGVASVSTATNAKAIDPVEFERKLMKEFGRGKRTAELGFTIFSIATAGTSAKLIDDICQLLIYTGMDLSGGTARMERRVTTDANLYASAESKYLVTVNENTQPIKKRSWVRRVAKINRHLKIKELLELKPTEIETKGTYLKEAKEKKASVTVSATHPTKVTATIDATAFLKCKAKGNGVAESSVESKTATCIVGFCVSQDGGMKYKLLQDSGLFMVGDKAKEIAKTETDKFEKAIDDYFKDLSTQLQGSSFSEIKKHIKANVEDDLKSITNKWVN
ncbi:hypothetical protein [uncultured Draconibacterium sp.]|uniref:hypothetical protein n=1 Tax=uncultured Draconibacterium sp. TaxID=1573823 RepID=UPI0025F9EAB8|nr:hypothetical protein [uncultured Draconibacterium sp.]